MERPDDLVRAVEAAAVSFWHWTLWRIVFGTTTAIR